MADRLTPAEEDTIQRMLLRASGQGWGVAAGLVLGLGLFAATAILVVRGGPNPGPHLSLLRIYFPGYSVTWPGAFIGFAYAFVAGYVSGRVVAAIYNRLIASR